MDYGPYSVLKMAHVSQQSRLLALAENRLPCPSQVHLVPTNRCNHHCLFCSYRTESSRCSQLFDSRDHIPRRRLYELMSEFKVAGVSSVQFTGGGEPTCHPDFGEVLQHVQKLGIESALVTNGSFLQRLSKDNLLQLAWLRVSIDAGSPETYAKIRNVSSAVWFQVLDNIRTLTKQRENSQSKIKIGLGFVVTPDNWQEVEAFLVMACAIGGGNVRIGASFFETDKEAHASYHDKVKAQIDRARKHSGNLRIFDYFSDRLSDLMQQKPDYPVCLYARLVPYIGADQQVYTCCNMSYNKRGRIGSIAETPFDVFWRTQADKFFHRHTTAICGACTFDEKNRFLRYLTTDVEHVFFV